MTTDRSNGLLRKPEHSQQATFLELFFDLVFIYALGMVVSLIINDLQRGDVAYRWVALSEIGQALLLFLPLMWVWVMTAWATSRFNPLSPPVQLVVVATMGGVLIMSAAVPRALSSGGLIFTGTYVAIQVGRSLFFALATRGHELSRVHLRELVWFCGSGVPWLGGGLMHGVSRDLLWLLAMAIDYLAVQLRWPVPGLDRTWNTAWENSTEHLADRIRQFLIIALGESILVIGRAYTDQTKIDSPRTAAVAIAFVTTVLLWRIYFYRAGLILGQAIIRSSDRTRLGRVAGRGVLAMVSGLIVTTAGHGLTIADPIGRIPPAWILVIFGGPTLYLAGRASFEYVVFGRVSPPRMIGILVFAAVGPFMGGAPPLAVAGTAALVLLGIAITDAIRAHGKPLEQPSPPF